MLAVATAVDVKEQNLRNANSLIRQCSDGQPIEVHNATHLHGFCGALKSGEFIIEGDAGDYLGVLNDGASIEVAGSVGHYVGDNMTRGTILVRGSAGDAAGVYSYGGTLVVRGNAGDFAGTMNKGATIIVCGNVGDEAGTYQLAGDLIVVGDAGLNFGNFLIRGNIYLGGEFASAGHNTRLEDLTKEDGQKLRRLFEQFDIKADVDKFRKLVAESQKPFYE